jgi:hypothetical protein
MTAMYTTARYRVRPGMMSIVVASQMTRRIRSSTRDEGWVFMICLPEQSNVYKKRSPFALLSKELAQMACGFTRDYKAARGGSLCEGLDV